MDTRENSDPVGERLSGFIQAISAMQDPPVPLLRFKGHLAELLRVHQGQAPANDHMQQMDGLGAPCAEEEELCRHTLVFLESAPGCERAASVLAAIIGGLDAARRAALRGTHAVMGAGAAAADASAQQPASPRPVYVSEGIDVYYDDAAAHRLRTRNDLNYLSADGIIAVDKERWLEAQRYEKKTWMERCLGESDDRNFEHEARFDMYEALAGRSFEHVIELGCGPFTNLRLILPRLKSAGRVTLLDPLITEYVHHPHCTYKQGMLSGRMVQTIASSIEEFDPPPGSFDLVVMNNVLEHCFNIPKILETLASMTREGGILVFADVVFSPADVRRLAETHYDAGHPIRLSESLVRRFLGTGFRTIYEKTFEGLYDQPYRKDIYFIGESLGRSHPVAASEAAAVADQAAPGPVLHFVYAGDPRDDRAISAPGTITNRLFRLFEQHLPVRYYDLEDETTPVRVGINDIIIGHPHPKANTALRRLFARPAAAKILLWPFHSTLPEINRYVCDLAEEADRLLMISGPYWTDRIEETEFGRWKEKIVRLDNAVDPAFFTLKKTRFNPPGERGLFVLGRSGKEKGTRQLFELLAKTDCRTVIAGDYADEDLGIIRGRKNLRHIGRLSWSDAPMVERVMSECDFFINLSVSDASPTTLFEAMASGLIPMTTPQCGYYYPSFILLTGSDPMIDLNILQHAQSYSEENLKTLQHANRLLIERRHNWNVLTEEVWNAVTASPAARQRRAQQSRAKKMIVAGEAAQALDLTMIDDHSAFAGEITAVFAKSRPKKIIETGTYLGTGTTAIIASALKELAISDAEFYSIEIDPGHHARASENLREAGLLGAVTLLNGVSVPRVLLPSYEEIERSTVGREEDEQIFVDHQEHERARLYFEETDFQKVPDDLLGACLKKFAYKPDFVLLDSAGHMGFTEFTYLVSQLRGDCTIALDDIWHIKHYRSFRQMQNDPRFEIIVSSKEKFGFCLARFTYDPASAAADSGELREDPQAEKEIISCPFCASDECSVVHAPDIVRCAVCGFVYLRERPTRQWMENYYRTMYAVNDPGAAVTVAVPADVRLLDIRADYIAAQRRELFDEAAAFYGKELGQGTIVDIGCGWGALLYNAQRRGMKAIGFELTDHNVRFARNVLKLDVRQEQFTDSTIPEQTIDIVSMSHVLEHVPDPLALVQKIRSVLKPGGIFTCVVPNFGSLCSAALGEKWEWLDRTWHYSQFTTDSLSAVFRKAGLQIEKLTTAAGDYGQDAPLQVLKARYPERSDEERAILLQELNKQQYGEEIRIIGRKPLEEEAVAEVNAAPKRNLVWIRSDAIGDNILASSMLRPLKEVFPGYALTAVCQTAVRELYEACPHVDNIISFDARRLLTDKAYQQSIAGELRALDAEKAFNSVYSRDPISDYLTLNSCAKERIAHEGDLSNITAEQRAANDRYYTRIIAAEPGPRTELERHRDFLAGIGIHVSETEPVMWLGEEDRAYADELFAAHGLSGERTIALFAGAQHEVRLYGDYGKALDLFCARHGYEVIVLGSSKDGPINSLNIRDLQHCMRADLTGTTTLRQSAAIIGKCAAAVGAETGLAHMACAVGTPNLILLGGGHFGRFMPYSALTTIVALPLDCFGCNWQCRYGTTNCVKDVDHRVIIEALEAMFAKKPGTRLLCLQASYRYDFITEFPKRSGVGHLLKGEFEVLTIDPFRHHAPRAGVKELSDGVNDGSVRMDLAALHELFSRNDPDIGSYARLEKRVAGHADRLRAAAAAAAAGGEGDPFFHYVMGLLSERSGDDEKSYECYLRSLKRWRNPRALYKLAETSMRLALPAYPIYLYRELLASGIVSDEVKKRSKMLIDLMTVKTLQKLTPVAAGLVMPPPLALEDAAACEPARSAAAPLVSFVLPSKNRIDGLTAFLESLEAACVGIPYEVLLYAGDTADDRHLPLIARHRITKVYTDSEIFAEGEKFSWTKLMNHGFRHSEAGWIMYASDDIVLHPFAIHCALHCAAETKAAGGVSFMHRNTIQDYDGYFRDYGFDRYGERPFINFGLIKRSAFMKVKGFDENLKFYAGDTDLCWRIVEAGFEIVPSYYSLVEHINIEDKTKVSNSGATYRRDMQAFYKKWLPAINRLKDRVIVRERFTLPDALRVKRHLVETALGRGVPLERMSAVDKDYQALASARREPKEPAIRVSAVVSACNSARFMRGCLDDLIGQSLYRSGELEIIVIDSGSDEDEAGIVEEYQQTHPHIVYERTERETIYAAWNRGIRRARGKFITNANADDRHAPFALEILADILEKEERIGVAYADVYQTVVPNDTFDSKTVKTPITWMDFDADLLLFGCFIGPQPMWRRSLHEQYGYFDPSLEVVGDYEFWLRLSRSVLFHHHREALGLYYLSQHSAEHRDRDATRREDERVRERYLIKNLPCVDDVNRVERKLDMIGRNKELREYCANAMALLRRRREALEAGRAPEEAIAQAEALIEEGETVRARAVIDAVLAVHPEHIGALNDLSVLEIMEKRWMEAAVLIHKVIGLEPENESARQNLQYLAQATAPVGRN